MNRAVLTLVGAAAALVIVIAVIAILLVSQGDGGGGATGGGARPTEQASGDGNGDSTGKRVLRIPGSDPITLDPAVAQDVESATYIVEIFGGLVTLDENLNVIADLAAEVPTKENGGISPDGTVYTFHIRDDAFFHDRRPVTAEDVKYSWERALDPSTASVVAEFYLGDIVGARDKARGRAEEVSGIEVVDDRTLRVTIDAPKPYFLQKLTYPTAFVVDRREVESNPRNWTLKPNGTGPFKLKEWRLGERIVLEANRDYHLGAPKVDEVQFLLAGGGLSAYEAGDVDISGVPLDDTERIQDPSEPLNAEYHTADDLSIFYIGFNTERPPFDDVKVRQAFAMSIDREKINEVVLFNRARVANAIMPPDLPGHDPNAQTLPYDPERARQLLAESKYGGPDGLPEITVAESGGGASAGPILETVVAMWKENLGVDVKIEQAQSATFFADIDAGRYQAFNLGWIMDYPDPEDLLDIKFHSRSRQNDTRYSNPEVDRLLEEARTEQDQERRFELYRQAERLIIQDAPWIPLFFGRDHILIKPYVKDYKLTPIVIPKLRFVSIER